MSKLSAKLSITAASLFSAFATSGAHAVDPGLAPWLVQMGETTSILSAAKWGTGQILGVVDTGIVASNAVFARGQVSAALSSCAAVSFKCSNGVTDDNGHGTAVASIAAANRPSPYTYSYSGYTVAANSYIGVAPNANIVAEKVLNSSGSGYNTDVANGINKAVAAGASVINLSLTYMATSDIVAAVNNAAAKGVFIVWAGGNDAKSLLANANTSGLTANAVKHLVLAGALDTTAAKAASFSNNPGTGSLIDTSGGKTSYAARWISAPGVNILAPGIQYGPTAMATWSGTSMAAPLVSGSLVLLQSAWPILKTNGTAADLLLATATDLGNKGVDSVYGNGRVNLSTAFQPFGTLTTTLANGKSSAVNSLTGALITGGALGSLTAVKAKLANYAAFDGYQRNFTVDLSGLILSKPTAAKVNPLPSNVNSGVAVMKFADGSEMTSWNLPSSGEFDRLGALGGSHEGAASNIGYVSFTNRAGTTIAMGQGVSSQMSFAKALYGDDTLAFMASDMAVSGLADLAQGGMHVAYGMKAAQATRVALAFSRTPAAYTPANPLWGTAGMSTDAANTHFSVGMTHKVNDRFTGGVSVGYLNETNSLLASSYDAHSPLGLGNNRTTSLGLSLAYALDTNTSVLAELGAAFTKGAHSDGLMAGTTSIQSRSYGVSLLTKNLMTDDDRLAVSVKQPLRVVSGKALLVVPSVDESGLAHYATERVSLTPNGREIDFKMAYDAPISKKQSLSFQFDARRDVMNMAGNHDASIGAVWSAKF